MVGAAIVGALADERHSAKVYEDTFKYVLGTLLKVDEKMLAQHMSHYKQTKQARDKAWIMKAVQSKVSRITDPLYFSPSEHKHTHIHTHFIFPCATHTHYESLTEQWMIQTDMPRQHAQGGSQHAVFWPAEAVPVACRIRRVRFLEFRGHFLERILRGGQHHRGLRRFRGVVHHI